MSIPVIEPDPTPPQQSAVEQLDEILQDARLYDLRLQQGRVAVAMSADQFYGYRDELGNRYSGNGRQVISMIADAVHYLPRGNGSRAWLDFYTSRSETNPNIKLTPWLSVIVGGVNFTQRIAPEDLATVNEQHWTDEQLATAFLAKIENDQKHDDDVSE